MTVKIGKIVNTQGIKGELRILSNSDFKDERFKSGEVLTLKTRTGDVKLVIESSRPHKTFQLIKFKGYDNINDVMQYKNCDIYAREFTADELPDGEYLNKDLIDCTVYNQEDVKIGMVTEIIENPAHNLLRIVDGDKKYLVPFNEVFIDDVILADKKIIINEIEGLIE